MSDLRFIIGLIIGVILLITMVAKTKIHAFPALILSAIITGLIGGMDTTAIVKAITSGFGNTLSSIGIIIGFGVMMGQIFELSGAAETMALTFIKIFGKKREHIALAITGWVVSIPIFCDSGFILLSPIAKAISKKTSKSIFVLGYSLAVGLLISHHMILPTPGPLAATVNYGADLGQSILMGIIFCIPMLIGTLIYTNYVGSKIYQIPSDDGGWIREEKPNKKTEEDFELKPSRDDLPNAFLSFLPILLPIILILLGTVLGNIFKSADKSNALISAINFVGNPVIAVGIGLLISIFTLTNKMSRNETLKVMELGITGCGVILLVTGAGGSFGQILKDSGVANSIAEFIASTKIPAILIPFVIATVVRFIVGSGTVAIVTSSSICAPLLNQLGINPTLGTMASCSGAMFFSYFNDSYFWVINRTLGVEDIKEQIRHWSINTTIGWAIGLITLLIFDIFI